MANKLTKEKIDLLIEQVLSENDGLKRTKYYGQTPKNIVFGTVGNGLKYATGTKHNDKQTPITNSKTLDIISGAADTEPEPSGTLNLEDIKQFFIRINSVEKKRVLHWLNVYRDYIEFLNDDAEKAKWNATIYLKRKTIDSKLENTDAYYKFNFLNSEGKPIATKEGFDQNYAELEFSPEIASDMAKIPDVRKYPSGDMDLFNLEMSNITGEEGRFPPDIQNTAATLFSGLNLYQRIEKISKLSIKYFNAKEFRTKEEAPKTSDINEIQTSFSEVVFLDYLNTMVKNFDERAGAYMFEHFLAMIAGGKVVGARASIDDDTVTDFEIGSGRNAKKGSSKYYSSKDGIGQALSGFINSEGKAVNLGVDRDGKKIPQLFHYIVALKDKAKVKKGNRIMGLKLYYFVVVPTDTVNPDELRIRTFSPTDKGVVLTNKIYKKTDKKVKFNQGENYTNETLVGELKMLSTDENDYTKNIKKAVSKIDQNLSSITVKASSVATESKKMNRNLREYIMGEKKAGDKSVESFATTISNLKSLYDELHNLGFRTTDQEAQGVGAKSLSTKIPSDQAALDLAENKTKSLKELDKLIERVILNKMNKL